MKLQSEIKRTLTIGGESVTFTLRRPSNQELNTFLASRHEVGKRGSLKDTSNEARGALFDKLVTGISGLEDDAGAPIGPEQKDLIPANWKAAVIFSAFEDMEIDEKN